MAGGDGRRAPNGTILHGQALVMKPLAALLAAIGLVVTLGTAGPAAAYEWHFHHDFDHDFRHHRHHGPGIGFYFGFGSGPFAIHHWPPPIIVYQAPPPPAVVAAAPPPSIHAVPASPDYTDSLGRTCREFRTTVTIGGKPQPSYGTACQESDGSWHIMP